MISKRYQRVIEEYLVDLNAQKTGERCGYSSKYARQTVYKILRKPEVKAALDKAFKESRMSPEEVIRRLEAMAVGDAPTKVIKGTHEREEYDTKSATDSLGKVYALFVDRQIVSEIDGLEVVDQDSED